MIDKTQANVGKVAALDFTEGELRQLAVAMLAYTDMLRAAGQNSGAEWEDAWTANVKLGRRNLRNTATCPRCNDKAPDACSHSSHDDEWSTGWDGQDRC
jgi:hypothetical protein